MAHRSGHNENSTDQAKLLEIFDDDFSEMVALGKRIGPAALNSLLEIFGGQKPHIPTVHAFWRSLEVTVRNEEIRARFRGNNLRQLVLEYELSERQLRNIVAGERYVRPPLSAPPRSFKLSEARASQVQALAEGHHMTLRAMHEILIAVVLALPDLQQRVAAEIGQLNLFEPKEAERTTNAAQAVTANA